jgi:hypothetical protein
MNSTKEVEPINYKYKYHEHIRTHYVLKPGNNALEFTDEECIQKQSGIITELISKLGKNIIQGKGIMNVSLPIRIFDERSLLEVFAHQICLAPHFLEKAGLEEDPLEKMKYVTIINKVNYICD